VGIRVPIRLRSIEDYIVEVHGSFRQLTLSERQVLRGWADHIVDLIQAGWPVDTGLSRDGYFATIQASRRPLQIIIQDDVGYVQWVRRRGEKQAGLDFLWRRLIPQVLRQVQPALLADMKAAIDKTEAELQRQQPSTGGAVQGFLRLFGQAT
jgi:hypothetical protein